MSNVKLLMSCINMRTTIKQLHNQLKNKEVSVTEITQSYLDNINKLEPKIEAFITVTEKEALNQAKKVDKKISKGEKIKPLEGIPGAFKDNILIEGIKCTSASKMLENYVASYDATVIERLKEQGVVILGKTNMDEFAMGASTENSAFKKTKNPYDLKKVPGGTSGGSAAAVSSGEALFALGSDTGGSIRQPAAFCNSVALKPTYGRVSRYGLAPLCSSFDQIGPITNTVEDAAWVYDVISGPDEKDSTCINEASPELINGFYPHVKDLKCGVPKEFFGKGVDSNVKEKVEKAIKKLESLGADISEVSLPHSEYALACYYVVLPCEASSNLARYDGVRYGHSSENSKNLIDNYLKSRTEGFGDEVKRRIMIGSFALSAGYYDAYYKKALQVRTKIIEDFEKVFKKVDFLVTPTTPTTAFDLGEKTADPISMYMADLLTAPVSVSGLPAITLSCGFSNKLPCGLQIIGNYYKEKLILEVAGAYEMNTEWHKEEPKVIGA